MGAAFLLMTLIRALQVSWHCLRTQECQPWDLTEDTGHWERQKPHLQAPGFWER